MGWSGDKRGVWVVNANVGYVHAFTYMRAYCGPANNRNRNKQRRFFVYISVHLIQFLAKTTNKFVFYFYQIHNTELSCRLYPVK